MTSRKYEKAVGNKTPNSSPTSCSSSFWKKSPISGIPGRPNLSLNTSSSSTSSTPPAHSSTNISMPSSFRAFEASVSDAWAIQDDPMFQQNPNNSVVRTNNTEIAPQFFNGKSTSVKTPLSSPPLPISRAPTTATMISKVDRIEKVLCCETIDMDALRSLSWSGLSPGIRSKVWRILCGYLPGTMPRQDEVLKRKQQEYIQYVNQYFQTKDQENYQEIYRQIHIDIPRMSPVINLFQQKFVQDIFERILYLWAYRHPGSGYVQGINDLVTPFFLVFLQDHCPSNSELSDIDVEKTLTIDQVNAIEADSFWCLSKVLDGIQDHYTMAQPGIQLKVKQLEELVRRIDKQLHHHLISHEVQYLQFAFRWMNNILMRELPIKATVRLWDTYLSEVEGFSRFHLYVCAAFLIHWKSDLMKKNDFHTLLMFLQNLPTAKWGDSEIELLVAEAYKLSYMFADAPNHFQTPTNSSSRDNK